MTTGIFIENEGDQLLASIETHDCEPCVEIVIHEAGEESAMIRITSIDKFDKFVDRLRDLYYDMRHMSESNSANQEQAKGDDFIEGKEVQS